MLPATIGEQSHEEGIIPFEVPSSGAEAYTYYKIYGDLKSGPPPLIILHGGPAGGHEYCLPLAKFQFLYDTSVIFYDQIG